MNLHYFNLGDYLANSYYYFEYYDIKLKQMHIAKKDFFKQVDVFATTYRLSKIGNYGRYLRVVKKINAFLDDKDIDENYLREIELLVSKVFDDVYYVNEKEYDKDIQFLTSKINERTILSIPLLITRGLIYLEKGKDNPLTFQKEIIETLQLVEPFETILFGDILLLYQLIKVSYQNIHEPDFDFKKAINDMESSLDKSNTMTGYFKYVLSTVYYKRHDYLNAILYGNEALKYIEEDLNLQRIFLTNIHLASYYEKVDMITKAEELLHKISIINSFNPSKEVTHIIEQISAYCYFDEEAYNKAIELLTEILKHSDDVDNEILLSFCYFMIKDKQSMTKVVNHLLKSKNQPSTCQTRVINLMKYLCQEKSKTTIRNLVMECYKANDYSSTSITDTILKKIEKDFAL